MGEFKQYSAPLQVGVALSAAPATPLQLGLQLSGKLVTPSMHAQTDLEQVLPLATEQDLLEQAGSFLSQVAVVACLQSIPGCRIAKFGQGFPQPIPWLPQARHLWAKPCHEA